MQIKRQKIDRIHNLNSRNQMTEYIDPTECSKFLAKLKKVWLVNPDDPIKFKKGKFHLFTLYKYVKKDLCDFMVSHLQKRYETMFVEKTASLEHINMLIDKQPIDNVYYRLIDIVQILALRYEGPVANLAKIANNSQSVHTFSVTKNTNEGIGILECYDVPRGQRTLAEIEEAWFDYDPKSITEVIKDMKDWGSRPTVMHKTKNIYKGVLRGLWAKIKSFEGDIRVELIKRLWEESNEAVGMCADGHVGRLINVLSGFDEQFKSHMSPKDYFQNNMSLIAAADAPVKFKIDQANRLMDELEMPPDERQPWLDAF
jgi:hypothetical protein